MRFYYPLEHLHVLPLKHYRQWGLYRINPQCHCSLKTRRKTHWSVSTGEKTGPSPTDRHWPGHGALVWNLPGFVSYQKKWLLQRKRRQLDIFMHAEINPCLQCLMKLCRLKDKSLLLFLLLLSFVFLLLFLCAWAGKNTGNSGGSLPLPWWEEIGPLPSSQDIHMSSDCSIFAALLPVPNPL